MRKFRIVATIDQYGYKGKTDKVYTVQMYKCELLFFYTWVDIKSYETLDQATAALLHLNQPDIYL